MWAFFTWLWNGLKALVGLILPVAGQARRIASPAVRWGLRIVLLILFVVVLFALNWRFGVERFVPIGPRFVAYLYLPILGMLILGWVWLGWYLWKLFTEPVDSDFPDIDSAWAEAVAALSEENIDLAKTPVFLVLGRPLGGMTALLEAAVAPSGRPLRVPGAPRGGKVLRVYANDEGVYVTCTGASVLGRHADLVAQLGSAPAAAAAPNLLGAPARPAPAGGTIFGTMRISGDMRKVMEAMAGQKGAASPEEQRKMRDLLGPMSFAAGSSGHEASLVRDEAELEEDAARLEYLCRLIGRQRQPELPVKGVLVLVPWAGASSDEAAAATAEAARRDLAAARAGLRASCPVMAMVSDLETAPGFREFVGHFKEDRRKKGRVGRKFPLLPELAGNRGLADVIGSGLAWFCTSEFPTWIYEFFTLEQVESDRPEQTTEGNVRLYQILAQLLERHERVSRILAPALAAEAGDPAMFGGCYLAATGNRPEHDQAFIAAVVHRLIEEHKNASWSRRAVTEDARQRLQGTWGLLAAAVGLLLLAAAISYGVYVW